MIAIAILLIISLGLFFYFDRKRIVRKKHHHNKRREDLLELLKSIKNKKMKDNEKQ